MSYIFGIGCLICFIVSFILIWKEPRRIINGFIIELGLFLMYCLLFAVSQAGDTLFEFGRILLYINYIVIFTIGIFLIFNFFLVSKREGMSKTNLLPLGFGLLSLVVAYSGYQEVIYGLSGSMNYVIIMSILYNIATYLPFAFGAVLIYSLIYLVLPKGKNYDYIIVLGCSIKKNGEVTPLLKGRVDKAIEYYHKNNKAKIIVSGGQGIDEVISEAQSMKNYLISQGIPNDKIILEDKSTSTKENLLFSKKKIKKNSKVIICTNNYHALRTAIFSKELGINAQVVGGHTAFYYLPAAFFREYIALVFKYKYLIIIYIFIAVLSSL